MVNKIERHKKMLDLLQKRRNIGPLELSQNLGVSLVTVRRDLKELQASGCILTGYGVVKLSSSKSGSEQYFDRRLQVNVEVKKRLAQKAMEYVDENDIIFLGAGTTCYYLAEMLLNNFSSLHIVTNGIKCLELFSSVGEFNVESLGGSLLHGFSSLIGPKAESALESSFFSKCFVSCVAYREENGIYDISPFTASLKKMVIKQTERSFMMVDSSKINAVAHSFVASIDDIDVVITDSTHLSGRPGQVVRSDS